MKKFNPSTMPDNVSPTVKALRTMVEQAIDNELEKVENASGYDVACTVEKSLRAVTMKIFHNNPDVHTAVKDNINEFDDSIKKLFRIEV
jgi:glutamyl-tRNA reductase